MRLALVGALLVGIAAAIAWTRVAPTESAPLAWIATAHQLGPVSYRDPVGAISADAHWIAYSEGRFLRVRSIGGGPSVEFAPGRLQIRHLAWSPDSKTIVADGYDTPGSWGIYDRTSASSRPLWPDRKDAASIRQLTWSADGRTLAGIVNGRDGAELWTISLDGASKNATPVAARIAYPAWTKSGEIGCIATVGGRARVTVPCGGAAFGAQPDRDAYGPLAFSPDGATAYVSLANEAGTVDMWAIPASRGSPRRLTSFSRDTYAPSVAADGSVLFKLQNYRTTVAVVSAAAGGPTRTLTAFQSETPSWDPTGKWIGVTYGTWRRVPDDAKYPDIAQDAGIVSAEAVEPAAAVSSVVHDSASEDQSLCWSPNGEWIAFHSHKDQSDDIWIRRAAGSDATARRISVLGRGAEAGWPRWSSDGKWLLFTGASRTTHRTVMYVVGMDQASGTVSAPEREIAVSGLDADVFHAEWIDSGGSVAAIGKEGPGRHVIFTVGREGGPAKVVYRLSSEHDFPGLGASPDGSRLAFVAPAADGFFQVFVIPTAGGAPSQLTRDPSNKTQPAWSPDGRRIAFTVWSYEAQFWRLTP